ncbi:four helix bundle protein [uncultured Thiocystis sp.]|jgi:lipid-binding SYLF domain-containing protein|uniref:four helix bundle protein n=1 Tax=uncultured Thiocystis sp. TaxID=1202134 RepID=UPI0025DDD759|nr:four helix bundle protein [uncultured Thiocystis sp.]
MNHLNHLPIWRDANRLLLAIEQAVRQFPRYHKYTLGSDLRRQAMTVCRLILRAADKGEDQLARVARVVDAVDDLKLQIQLGKELQAFQGFGQFQVIAELAVAVGKQSGGWRKRLAAADGQHCSRS